MINDGRELMSQTEDPSGQLERQAARMFREVLAATHLSRPGELTGLLADRARHIGALELVLYLIDYEQTELLPVPGPHADSRSVQRVEGTLAGRCFAQTSIQDLEGPAPGTRRLWLPLLDGTERLGVVEMVMTEAGEEVSTAVVEICERLSHLAAQLVVGKSHYGDVFELVRRRRPMTVAAEMQWNLLPPLVFATHGLVITALLEPAYDVGGDSFDYAVNDTTAHFAVFDAMGHGLSAAVTASVAVAAYRGSRRRLLDLSGAYAEIDGAIARQFGGERYATAVLARLEIETGILTWVSAGHPSPLLLRAGRFVKLLEAPPSPPLGVQLHDDSPVAAREALEPGDQILFYTDGLVEARDADGGFFTVERLAEFLEREAAAGLPAPETLRRLRHAVLGYQNGQLQDDATALLVDWRRGSEDALVPQTI
jgi:serine phosphatase RsbU (regulator of sigma subunit)